MANYMAEVAKMLGVNICEEFEIKGYSSKYMFINDGMIDAESGFVCDATLWKLLIGEVSIKRQPWKPNKDDGYWTVMRDGSVYCATWCGDLIDIHCYKIGNCYRSNKEAEDNRDKWVAFYESDEVLEV